MQTRFLGLREVVVKLRENEPKELGHRRGLIQNTDYIANYFFRNLRVSMAKIENLE